MLSEKDIFIEEYMSFTFNEGTPIYFSNHEVRGNVEYVPASTPEMLESESGVVVSINRPQREYFKFKIQYENPTTRNKINSIFKLIKSAYKLNFGFPHFIAPFTTFPPVDALVALDNNYKSTGGFSSAVVEFPKDFSFDRIGRGQGAEIVKDIEIRVYKSAAFSIPLSPCATMNAKSTTDLFTLHPWNLDGSDILQYILVEPKSSEISVTSWPVGILFFDNVITGMRDILNPAGMVGNAQKYVPSGSNTISGTWSFGISFIPVTLPTGKACSVTSFSQDYGTPPGDFNNDFNSDFN